MAYIGGSDVKSASQTNVIRKSSALEDQIDRARAICERLEGLNQRLSNTADRLSGESPEACGTSQDQAGYGGAIGRLSCVLDSMAAILSSVEHSASRLQSAI